MGSSFAILLAVLRILIPLSWMMIHLVRYRGINSIPKFLGFIVPLSLVALFIFEFSLQMGWIFLWNWSHLFSVLFLVFINISAWALLGLVFVSVQTESNRVKNKIAVRLPFFGALLSYFFANELTSVVVIIGTWLILWLMIDRFRSVFYLFTKMIIFLVGFYYLHSYTNIWITDLMLVPVLIYLGIIINQLLLKDFISAQGENS